MDEWIGAGAETIDPPRSHPSIHPPRQSAHDPCSISRMCMCMRMRKPWTHNSAVMREASVP